MRPKRGRASHTHHHFGNVSIIIKTAIFIHYILQCFNLRLYERACPFINGKIFKILCFPLLLENIYKIKKIKSSFDAHTITKLVGGGVRGWWGWGVGGGGAWVLYLCLS